ncbi:hypothetical protein K0B90_06865 [bacterium]|nr:hypothetical protein [bacterium]
MKANLVRMAVLAVAAVTMAAPALAGENPTDWGMQLADPAKEVDAGTRPTAPDSKGYEYRTGVETGNLPSDMGASGAGSGPAVDFPWYENTGGGE